MTKFFLFSALLALSFSAFAQKDSLKKTKEAS